MVCIMLSLIIGCAIVGSVLSADFDPASSIRLLQIGDWGGKEDPPYTTPSQVDTAAAMGTIGEQLQVQYVLALGDNFYHSGINGSCFNPRFDETWNDVYTAPSLYVPWLVNAGNHDHKGNISAQIAYTDQSTRWVFPALYHKHSLFSDDNSVSLDVILIDTTSYTGVNSGTDYPAEVQDPEQQAWIAAALEESTADYIIVGTHYPMYSVCDHGNTLTLINNLKPLLEKYNAHVMSGHDHCAEHFVENGISYWLNGIGHGCCYQNMNMDTAPTGSLQYYIANTDPGTQIDDDGVEVGVNGTVGGFSGLILTKEKMVVNYYNQRSELLYSSYVLPRTLNQDDGGSSSFPMVYIIMCCVGGFLLSVIILLYLISHGWVKGFQWNRPRSETEDASALRKTRKSSTKYPVNQWILDHPGMDINEYDEDEEEEGHGGDEESLNSGGATENTKRNAGGGGGMVKDISAINAAYEEESYQDHNDYHHYDHDDKEDEDEHEDHHEQEQEEEEEEETAEDVMLQRAGGNSTRVPLLSGGGGGGGGGNGKHNNKKKGKGKR